MSKRYQATVDFPVFRLFVELEPREFTRRFNNAIGRTLYAPPRTAAQLREWQQQQRAVRAVLNRWDTRDLYTSEPQARADMVRLVNAGLAEYVTLRVSPDLKSFVPFAKDPKMFGMLGIVWIHMARLLTGQSPEATCAQCGARFVPRRADAEFCKPYCRLAAHRLRNRPTRSIPASIPTRPAPRNARKKKAAEISLNRP